MRLIAGLRLFAVVGILSLSLAGAASAADVTKFKAHGNTASSNSNDGTFVLDFSVQRNDTNSTNPETNLFFNRSVCDSNGCSGTFGFGIIPNSDFNAGAHNAKLNTNLAAVPGYQAFSFIQDFNTGEYTQTPITPPGPIIVDWKQVKNNSTKSTGTTVIKSGNLTVKTAGTIFTTSATVTGSFSGSPIVGSIGNLGKNTNVNVTIIRE